ncbi:hypothetical protein B4N84_04800 [Flavobacterium sp. IR1]|nr:hypothetical protein B4N84_04800 [Flavobacterium sp. IR1]
MQAILESYQILQILNYRFPFQLIDKVTNYKRGKELKAIKAVSMGEPYFAGHFPDFPIMPGVLITEALSQAASLMIALDDLGWEAGNSIPSAQRNVIGVLGSTQINFLKSVLPGSLLELDVNVNWRKGAACSINVKASVEGIICAKGKITVMMVDKNKLFS